MAIDIIARGMAGNAQAGHTTDYETLLNLPKINGVELVGNLDSTDIKVYPEYAESNSLAWGQYYNAGVVTPNVTLPAYDEPTGTQTLLYIFVADTANASFTAPNDAMLIETGGTDTYAEGNTLTYDNLETGTLYVIKFSCYTVEIGGNERHYILLEGLGHNIA